MNSGLSIKKTNSGTITHIQWRNPLPKCAKRSWAILGFTIAVIWAYLAYSIISESGLFQILTISFSVVIALATLTLLLIAIRATFGDRTESITFERDTLRYSRAPECTYLFFGDGIEETELAVHRTRSPVGAAAIAVGGRTSLVLHRSNVIEVTSGPRCTVVVDGGSFAVGLNLDPDDVATIAHAINAWKIGSL